MKNILLFLLLLAFSAQAQAQEFNYERNWGTYFGDERFSLQESKVDKQGNLYIVGRINQSEGSVMPEFNLTDAYQPVFGGGVADGFVAKFNTSGQLLWATYFGGPGEDMINGIDLDEQNNLYLVGTTSSNGQIATPGAYQTNLNGLSDFFIARMSPGGMLEWSSYYGGSGIDGAGIVLATHVSTDKRVHISQNQTGHFYIAGYSDSVGMGTPGTFQPLIEDSKCIIAKFDNDGSRIWHSYYSSNENIITGLSATATALYVRGFVLDCVPFMPYNTYYGTEGAHQPFPLNCSNSFLSKFDADGQRIWSTYYGNQSRTFSNTVVAYNDKVYFSGDGIGSAFTTPGTFQETAGEEMPAYLVQFTENGMREWGTFIGSNVGYPASGAGFSNSIAVNGIDDIYLTGITHLHSNIGTPDGYIPELPGIVSGYVCKFDKHGQKVWGTYYGGNGRMWEMHTNPYHDGFYVVGRTSSNSGIATPDSYQPDLMYDGTAPQTIINIFIGHFKNSPLATVTVQEQPFEVFPNPNDGKFTVLLKDTAVKNGTLELYSMLGKKVWSQQLTGIETMIRTNSLSKGVYLAKIHAETQSQVAKLIVQ